MNWFSRHPGWFYQECKELSNNSIYKETLQAVDHTLVSCGNILIHKEQTERHPIIILYPDATPYVPPIIYLLKEIPSEELVKRYSTLCLDSIQQDLKDRTKIAFRRHQNADGSICYLESGDLHADTAEGYPIKTIIKRLREWLAGRIPVDSPEVELYAHFPKRYEKIHLLLPDNFFDTEITRGAFYFAKPYIIQANRLKDYKIAYIGVYIDGVNSSGVSILPKICVKDDLILFAEIPKLKSILSEDQKLKKAIEEGDLITGFWWDISQEPAPFSGFDELAGLIGNGDMKAGMQEMTSRLRKALKANDDRLTLGLRFPGRRGRSRDWQFFSLKRGKRNILIVDSEEELESRLRDYDIEAINHEYFTDEYFHMRNAGCSNREILASKCVSVIGCGALGAEIADSLGKAGIQRLHLVDKEGFAAHNSIRHVLGLESINVPKVIGVNAHLVMHNPFVNVSHSGSDVFRAQVDEYLPHDFLGVSSIADDNIEGYINEQAVSAGRPVFYCRALRGGKTARIFRVIPGRDACKTCLAIYKQERNPLFLDIPEDPSLPPITNECNNPIRPGSAADLKIPAAFLARLVIDYLESQSVTDANHWVWTTENFDGNMLPADAVAIVKKYSIQPHPNCPTCQPLEAKTVVINKSVFEFMRNKAAESDSVETGGILIGYRHNNEYQIVRATDSGPNAIREATRFEKDISYCQEQLKLASIELGSHGMYLGEWHYHPAGSNQASGRDIKSLTEIAAQDNYAIDKPIMMILGPQFEAALTIHEKSGKCINLPLRILDTTS